MKVELNILGVVRALSGEVDYIQDYHRARGQGLSGERVASVWECSERAVRTIIVAAYVLGRSSSALWQLLITVRRWYARTKYERCIPESIAERLWEYYMKEEV